MNTSAIEVALVPPGVVTVTSTGPFPAGEKAVHDVALAQLTLRAEFDPNFAVASLVKPVPVIVTGVPPAFGP